jgi:hypothetical protein
VVQEKTVKSIGNSKVHINYNCSPALTESLCKNLITLEKKNNKVSS